MSNLLHWVFCIPKWTNQYLPIDKKWHVQVVTGVSNVRLHQTAVYSIDQCAAPSSGTLIPRGVCVNGAEWTQRSTLHQLFASVQCKDSLDSKHLSKKWFFFFHWALHRAWISYFSLIKANKGMVGIRKGRGSKKKWRGMEIDTNKEGRREIVIDM